MDAECEKRIIACHERGLSLFDAALTSDIPVLDVLAVYREHDWFRTSERDRECVTVVRTSDRRRTRRSRRRSSRNRS